MEEVVRFLLDYASALVVERWVELVALGVLLALWRWWMAREFRDRILALEARPSTPAISQTINFNVGADAHDHDRQLRNAIEAETVHGLKETINTLTQHPLGDGHTYAELPDGTRIVTMADGTIRLALPVNLAAAVSAGAPSATAVLTVHNPASDDDS